MKILCVADHVDSLVYSERIKERFNDIDLVLGAGDLPLYYYEYIISCLNKTLLFVFGNHNLKKYNYFKKDFDKLMQDTRSSHMKPNYFGSVCIGGKVKYLRKKKLIVAGLGGSINYNNGKNQYTEFGMFMIILKIIPKLLINRIFRGRYLDILLTHSPPFGLGDKEDRCHRGFKVFKWFIRKFKPQYLIHGHVHLSRCCSNEREIEYEGTKIINCYNHIELEVSGKKLNGK